MDFSIAILRIDMIFLHALMHRGTTDMLSKTPEVNYFSHVAASGDASSSAVPCFVSENTKGKNCVEPLRSSRATADCASSFDSTSLLLSIALKRKCVYTKNMRVWEWMRVLIS